MEKTLLKTPVSWFLIIADTDTEKYHVQSISAMNLDKRYPLFAYPLSADPLLQHAECAISRLGGSFGNVHITTDLNDAHLPSVSIPLTQKFKRNETVYDFRNNYLQKCESKCESKIRGEVSMWTSM